MVNQDEITEMSSSSNQTSNDICKEFNLKVLNVENTGINYASVESANYFNDKLIKRDDPLNWWFLNGKCNPNMSMLSKKYFCKTTPSVPSEQLFARLENWFR